MKGYVDISLYDDKNRILTKQNGHNAITNHHLTYIDKVYLKSNAILLSDPWDVYNEPFPLIDKGLGYLTLFGDRIEDDEYKVYKSYLAYGYGETPASEEQIESLLNNPGYHDGVLVDISKTSSRITKTWKFGKGVYGDIASVSLMGGASYGTPYVKLAQSPANSQLIFFDPLDLNGYLITKSSNTITVKKAYYSANGINMPDFITSPVDSGSVIGSFSIQNANLYGRFTLDMEEGQPNTNDNWSAWACQRIDDTTVKIVYLFKDSNDECELNEYTLDLTSNAYKMYNHNVKPFIHNGYLCYVSKINSTDEYFDVICFSQLEFSNDGVAIIDDSYDRQVGNIRYDYNGVQVMFDGCIGCRRYDDFSLLYEPIPVVNGEIKKHVSLSSISFPDQTVCTKHSALLGGHIKYDNFAYVADNQYLYMLNCYLGTKFNLETPIHKGQNQTLAVSYTLNF